jgi:hypothetical protein
MSTLSIGEFTCGEAMYLAGAFVDGELPGRVQRRIADHLRGCRECADFVAALTLLKGRVRRTVQSIVVPAALIRQICAGVRLQEV